MAKTVEKTINRQNALIKISFLLQTHKRLIKTTNFQTIQMKARAGVFGQ